MEAMKNSDFKRLCMSVKQVIKRRIKKARSVKRAIRAGFLPKS